MEYILLTIATVLLAVSFSTQKIYQNHKGVSAASGFLYNAIIGLFTAVIFFCFNGFKMSFTWYSALMALMVNGLVVCYTIIGFKLLDMGTMAMYTLFLMSGGMIIPYIFGLAFLSEKFSIFRTFGLILIFLGVVMPNIGKEKINMKQVIMCFGVFILNGLVSVFSKLHQIDLGYMAVSTNDFVFIGAICKFIFAGIMYLITPKIAEEKIVKKNGFLILFIIFIGALASGVSYMLQLKGASTLPATVLYPFITGGSIIVSSLAGMILFREKPSRNVIIGVVLCFLGTIMFL